MLQRERCYRPERKMWQTRKRDVTDQREREIFSPLQDYVGKHPCPFRLFQTQLPKPIPTCFQSCHDSVQKRLITGWNQSVRTSLLEPVCWEQSAGFCLPTSEHWVLRVWYLLCSPLCGPVGKKWFMMDNVDTFVDWDVFVHRGSWVLQRLHFDAVAGENPVSWVKNLLLGEEPSPGWRTVSWFESRLLVGKLFLTALHRHLVAKSGLPGLCQSLLIGQACLFDVNHWLVRPVCLTLITDWSGLYVWRLITDRSGLYVWRKCVLNAKRWQAIVQGDTSYPKPSIMVNFTGWMNYTGGIPSILVNYTGSGMPSILVNYTGGSSMPSILVNYTGSSMPSNP